MEYVSVNVFLEGKEQLHSHMSWYSASCVQAQNVRITDFVHALVLLL